MRGDIDKRNTKRNKGKILQEISGDAIEKG